MGRLVFIGLAVVTTVTIQALLSLGWINPLNWT